MYYRLARDYDFPCGVTQEPDIFEELEDTYDVDFGSGQFLSKEVCEKLTDPIVFDVNCTSKNRPMHLQGISVPVMSDELVTLFLKAGADNLQTFPAVLKNPETEEVWSHYYAVNIVGVISCADMDASKYTVIGHRPGVDIPLAHFHNLVINEKRAHGHYIFRLAEEPHIILLNQVLKDALHDNKPSNDQWGTDCMHIESA